MKESFKKIFILSTAMLSFISFWRAGAIVLCDFGSSAYYAGGIAAKSFGQAFPYLIIAVMLFAGLMLMVYIESSSLFTRGGVYVVVREALGKTMAKVSVSTLIFDYLLTGPISSVSAGLYAASFLNLILIHINPQWHINDRVFAIIFSLIVVLFFARANIKGVKESSDSNVKIIIFVSFVAILLFIATIITIYHKGFTLPAFKFEFTPEALGWSKYISWLKPIGIIGIIIAFGHSILALSGLETLGQVYREIEDPKIKNLKKTVIFVFFFSLLFTGFLTFLSAIIIPYDKIINVYSDNLLGGLAMEMYLPEYLKIGLRTLVVFSAAFILVGAVNTSFVGANGILNRVAEDGILHEKLRALHPKYGTTYRLITIIAILQAIIIIFSGGNVFLLGEAYAFGVLWSLTFNVLSIIVLRFKKTDEKREWKFPINIKYDKYDVPIGLILIFIVLLVVSLMNLLTKEIATIAGISFTIVLFFIFTYSEKKSEKKVKLIEEDKGFEEKMNINAENDIEKIVSKFNKEYKILIPIRNPNNLIHLKKVLETVDDSKTDIILLYIKVEKGLESSGDVVLCNEEKEIFKNVILMAEKYGKIISPVILSSNAPFHTITLFALKIEADEIVMGVSGSFGAEVQLERIATYWGMLKKENYKKEIKIKIIWESRDLTYTLN